MNTELHKLSTTATSTTQLQLIGSHVHVHVHLHAYQNVELWLTEVFGDHPDAKDL